MSTSESLGGLGAGNFPLLTGIDNWSKWWPRISLLLKGIGSFGFLSMDKSALEAMKDDQKQLHWKAMSIVAS